jgi:hypothetical protein
MKKLIYILVLLSIVSFGCSDTEASKEMLAIRVHEYFPVNWFKKNADVQIVEDNGEIRKYIVTCDHYYGLFENWPDYYYVTVNQSDTVLSIWTK